MKDTTRPPRELSRVFLIKRGRFLFVFLLVIFAYTMPAFSMSRKAEVNLGKRLAKEIEQHYKVIKDPAVIAQVELVGSRLEKALKHPPYRFHFIVIKDKDINAFAIPGGYIFISDKLLDWVRSQDELAGVLAHEMSHCILKHPLKQAANNERLSLYAFLIAVATRSPQVAAFGNLMRIAFLTHYSREFEQQADLNAIKIIVAAGYNPVGLLTVMERFRARYIKHAHPELGVMQTHPSFTKRIAYIKKKIKSLGLPINRRKTARILVVNGGVSKRGNIYVAELRLDKDVLFSLSFSTKKRAETRLKEWERELDSALKIDIQPYEVTVVKGGDGAVLKIQNEIALDIKGEDTEENREKAYTILEAVRKKILMAVNRVRLKVPIY